MYTIDNSDKVIELTEVPQCSFGAPCPVILSGEHFLHLAYYLQEQEEWDGKTVRFADGQRSDELCALVRFKMVESYMFGMPSEDTLAGHPLYERGLRRYKVSEVSHSSWIRALKRTDAVDRQGKPERFAHLRHYIFPFHDRTFECVAASFELSIERGFVSDVLRTSWKENS